jgi:prepilin-type N-terminal cleavage/methylation domain-containing protein
MAVCVAEKRRRPRMEGFTLVEIVITIVIVGIIAGVAAEIIMQGVRAYSSGQFRSNVRYQADLAAERMAREIRLIRSRTATDIPLWNATDLSFMDINNNQVRFQLNNGVIRRSQDGGATWQALATGVSALTLSYYRNDGVTAATSAPEIWYIAIDVIDQQDAETLEVRTRVHPMNF